MKKTSFALAVGLLAFTSVSAPAHASVIWGNSASFGSVNLEAFDSDTGLLVAGQQFLVPNLTARGDNGRGVALLGDTIYYTTANSGNIYVTNTSTHADLGILVNTGFAGIANVATDGISIYAASYQTSSGIINKYDTSGNLVGTVNVGSGFGRDGFEVQNNPNLAGGATTFISNRGDAVSPYDVYASDGTLLVSAFINPSLNAFGTQQTGIAYDGNHYFVSDIFHNRLLEYDGTGAFLRIIDLSGITNPFTARLLEDLSAVGNTIENPPPSTVPEPGTLLLLSTSLAGIAAATRRRRRAQPSQ
jgi:PEP-CTERM motif-containing protein